ncbi:MAG TPA: dihydrofolate reductase family protein [Devosia sp.]|nr:dihydrofolate reductase family protein [Devosia sp.]
MKIIWRTAMSMDGRVAASGHDLSFLDSIDIGGEASDFPAFLASIDAIILGAGTLRWLLREGHGWPHKDIPTWLVSRDPALEAAIGPTEAPFRRMAGDLAPVMAEMEAEGYQRVWLAGGGDVAGQLLAIDRIDEVEATIAPQAVGGGYSLFGDRALAPKRFKIAQPPRLAGNAVIVTWVRAPGA